MRDILTTTLPIFALMIVVIFALSVATAQNAAPVSLQEQLAAQYKVVKMGSDSSGPSVVEAGTILAIQKGGILGVPYGDQSVLSTKYQDGTIHSPNTLLSKGIGFGMMRLGKEQTTHLFRVGDKVYPTKIDVNLSKDSVGLSIVACDSCNKTDPPTFYKATVVFQFAKGSIAKMGAATVEDTIGQVLAVSNDEGQQDQGGTQRDQDQQGAQEQQQAEPQTIQLGMTTDQVQAALGKPEKIVNLGAKQIYVYKDLKVTFVNGKVADVQ
jgi:hypothetical protein